MILSDGTKLLAENFAPWLTAIGAIVFGTLAHRRANKRNDQDRFQKTIEELHNLYHNLVADLGTQVERLTAANENLAEVNEKLTKTVEDLSSEKAALENTIDKMSKQLTSMQKSQKDLQAQVKGMSTRSSDHESTKRKPKK